MLYTPDLQFPRQQPAEGGKKKNTQTNNPPTQKTPQATTRIPKY